jgi:acetyl esterase
MIADAELAAWVESVRDSAPDLPTVAELRRDRLRSAGPHMALVRDEHLPGERGIGVRSYRHDPQRHRPTCVYVHGGGFVFGGLASHDRACRRLASLGGIDVVAVDYRLAPEHPSPAAVDDVREVITAMRRRLDDVLPLGVAGDSAGALIAFLAVESVEIPVERMLLVNPNVDLALSMPSVAEKGRGWGLEARQLEWFIRQWAPTERLRRGTALNPLRRSVGNVPPTTVVTSEHDPLRDEGIALAEHLDRAGRLAHHEHLEGMVHGAVNLDTVSPTARRMSDGFLRNFAASLHEARVGR